MKEDFVRAQRGSPEFREVVGRFWATLMSEELVREGSLRSPLDASAEDFCKHEFASFDTYVRFHSALTKTLEPTFDIKEATRVAVEDWGHDVATFRQPDMDVRNAHLTRELLNGSLYELSVVCESRLFHTHTASKTKQYINIQNLSSKCRVTLS